MKRYILITSLVLLINCGVQFELKKVTIGQGSLDKEAIRLTSDDFWVDRVDLHDLLRENGGYVWLSNPWRVCFVIDSALCRDEFIEMIRPKIAEWGRRNKK